MPVIKRDVIGSTPIIGATAGSIIFAGTNGVFQQDNANFFWDDTNNSFGLGTATPNATYFLDINSSTSLDKDRVINIVHANDADEASDVIKIVNTASPGTIAASRTLQNLNLSLTPTATIAGTKTLTLYGINTQTSLTSIAIGTTGANNTISAYGAYADMTGSPTVNNANSGQAIEAYGIYGSVGLTPTFTALGTSATYNTYGVFYTNTSASTGNANLTASAYGGYFSVTGDLTTTGTTTHYGGYFNSTGTADTNYGGYFASVTGGTANYGVRIDSASTNTLWVNGSTDSTAEAGGIVFGTSKDTNLYRLAANSLKTDDSFTVGTNLVVTGTSSFNGTVTIGDASSDAVTVNSNTWTFANDTNFVLSGGVNGLSFDTDTFSIDSTNDRVGIGTTAPGTKLEVGISTAQTTSRITGGSGSNLAPALSLFRTGLAEWTTSVVVTTGSLSLGANPSSYTDANLATAGKLIISTAGVVTPGGNKTQDLGTTALRWNTIFYVTATTGTSRMVESYVTCPKCGQRMQKGTGATIKAGEEFDYTEVICFKCKTTGVETFQHRPKADLSPPPAIIFKGFKVTALSGNARLVMINFEYGAGKDKKENSTLFGEVEYDEFLAMTQEQQKNFLREVGEREWYAMEEVRIMEEEKIRLQTKFDELAEEFTGKDLQSGQ